MRVQGLITVVICVLTSVGAVLSKELYWGYVLLVTPLIYEKKYLASTALLSVAFAQTLQWPFWISLALSFNFGLNK